MQNTLENIKTLQEREAGLYSSLGVSIDGAPLDSIGQEKILGEINSLTDLRVNLIQELENQYNLLNVNVKETDNDIADEIASIEVMEKQLDDKKKQISKLKNIEINKLRIADINNYYANRSQYIASIYYMVVLILTAVCVILVTRKLVPFIPSFVFDGLLFLVILGGSIGVLYKVYDLNARDKMNFDEYDYSGVDPKTTKPSVYEYNMKQLGDMRNVLVGQEQQLQGQIGNYFGNGDYLMHQCNTDDGKVYISANSKLYSQSNKSSTECQAACSADDNCEMYLMSDDNTCHLYKDVNNVSTYCSAGSGHSLWGKIKKHKSNDTKQKESFINLSSAFVPYEELDTNYSLNLIH
jgi:hypothetical protein